MRDQHVTRCRRFMRDHQWHTLAEIAREIGCSESAAGARVRDLRKSAYGAHRVLCRHTGPGGLHKYRLLRTRKGKNAQSQNPA